MLIRFLTGPRAGQTEHAERSPQTKLMIDAGMIEAVSPLPATPKKPTWSVGPNEHGIIVLQLALPTGEVIRYGREPEQVDASFRKGFAHCLPVPENVLAAYVASRNPKPLTSQAEWNRLRGEAETQKQNENQATAVVILNAGR